ncbi:MFS transporter [Streptacidiphilus monticola]
MGRRLPFLLGGAVLGLVALPAVALAPNVPLMGVAWVFALLGWTTAAQAILNLQADRIPEERRGKVSGLTGLTGQMGPIVGIGLVSAVSGHTLLVFMLPALVGAVLAAVFLRVGSRGESRTDTPVPAGPVSARTLLAGYTFSPRQNRDFAWNWLGRLTFFTGLYFNTTFSTFFYAQRLRMTVQDVAGTVAVIGMLGILAAALGAVGGGMLSDRLGRRRLFALVGGLFFVAGAVTEAFSHSFPQLVVGSVLMQLSIAFFTAVDQAIVMAVLPDQEEAGRYMTVGVLSLKIPSALAP